MIIRPGIELANLSDIGCQRTDNEDYYCYTEPEDDTEFQKKGRLVVVADGMGGHEGGQEASRIAVETIREVYLSDRSADPREALIAAFRNAHFAIQEFALEHSELSGMGTTCTAAVVRERELFYGHVGDSRLYLVRNAGIRQLTEDHSYVARLVREGVITTEQAIVHPERNVLLAALGMESAVPADFSEAPMPLEPDDILLLCTDGLHGLVSDDETLGLASSKPPAEACKDLIRLAKERGGFDNITVQILRIQ